MQESGTPEPEGTDASDDEAEPSQLFSQLQLYILGSFLASVLIEVSHLIWGILSGFQAPLLWALLCSIALRDLKQWLVTVCRQHLSHDRTILMILIDVLLLPLRAVRGTATDMYEILKTWKRYALEYEANYRRQQVEDSRRAHAADRSPEEAEVVKREAQGHEPVRRKPATLTVDAEDAATTEQARRPRRSSSSKARVKLRPKPSSSAQAFGAMSSLAKLGLKAALQGSERRTPWRKAPSAPAAAARQEREAAQAHARAQALFRWLFSSCMVYELFHWFLHTWAVALQLALVCFTVVALLGLLPLLYFLGHWYLVQQSPLEAWESPQRSLSRRWSSFGRASPAHPICRTPDTHGQREHGKVWSDPGNVQDEAATPMEDSTVEEDTQCQGTDVQRQALANEKGRKVWLEACQGVLRLVGGVLQSAYLGLDRLLRKGLHDNMNTFITVGLITGLILGTAGMGAFMGVQIAQEGRTAVRAVTEALPMWSPESSQGAATALAKQGGRLWQTRLREWQGLSVGLAKQQVPAIWSWLGSQMDSFVHRQNLTEVVRDVKTLAIAFQLAGACTVAERKTLTVASAKASLSWHSKWQQAQSALTQKDESEAALAAALAALERHQARLSSDPMPAAMGNASSCAGDGADTPPNLDLKAPAKLMEAQGALVAADERAMSSRQALQIAAREAEAARHEVDSTQRLLRRCLQPQGGAALSRRGGAVQPLVERLQAAYTDIWQLRLLQGLEKLKAVLWDAGKLAQEVLAGQGQPGGELGALQRAAQAAAEPLIALGQATASTALGYLGSSTAVALTSGLGVLRLGLGVLQAGVQFILFAGLLFVLLSADSDPLLYAVRVLPLSGSSQRQAAAAFSNAMRGVFLCALKLALFHALFTWLTLRMFETHFVYASTLASAIFALLPLIPSWLVAVPAALELFIQDRALAAVVLIAAHFGAWSFADDILLREIAGSHPYLTGLGIFGGMYTFDNPLQGAIVGPMLLSLLSVFFNLHSQYMGSAALSQQLSGLSSQRVTMSRSASFDSSTISRFRPIN